MHSPDASVSASAGMKNVPNVLDLVLVRMRRASWKILKTQIETLKHELIPHDEN
jgi:hypothetical protein